MKKFLLYLCALLLIAQNAHANDAISHTFFSVAGPTFKKASPLREIFFRNEKIDEKKDCGWGGAVQAVVYGGKSTNSCRLAKYFMPFGKRELNVFEYDVTAADPTGGDLNPEKDVEARNFNIQTVNGTFNSIISFHPEQEHIGVGIDYKQTLWRRHDHSVLWLELAFPIERIRNKMGLKEDVINDGGGALPVTGLDGTARQPNMIAAFNQAGWNYGKIAAGTCMTEWGVADLELTLNWSTVWGDCCRADGYVGMIAPTGSKVNACHARYVFSPVVGNNHHWGLTFGTQMQFALWECGRHSLTSAYDLCGRVLFRNHQVRSFDLEDKQWGRYLEVYTAAEAATAAAGIGNPYSGSSGINYFTQKVKVSPRYAADSNVAFIYRYRGLMIEGGYNLFLREAEHVCPAGPLSGVAIKGIVGLGTYNEARTIRGDYDGADLAYTTTPFADVEITEKNVSYNSAAHPAVISNTIYGGIGYEWECGVPMFFGLGGSYEFSRVNTTLQRWTAFGKMGISF